METAAPGVHFILMEEYVAGAALRPAPLPHPSPTAPRAASQAVLAFGGPLVPALRRKWA